MIRFTHYVWRSQEFGVQTPTYARNISVSYQLNYTYGTSILINIRSEPEKK
jgi:hypothetical protein